jgi:hypothetical protein
MEEDELLDEEVKAGKTDDEKGTSKGFVLAPLTPRIPSIAFSTSSDSGVSSSEI